MDSSLNVNDTTRDKVKDKFEEPVDAKEVSEEGCSSTDNIDAQAVVHNESPDDVARYD